jgi:uncharacterized circularly permuted ATP-grasp superfamily protein
MDSMEEAERFGLTGRLESELTRLARLPAGSSYAVHRKRCVTRALQLLYGARKQDHQTQDLNDELATLLGSLSL